MIDWLTRARERMLPTRVQRARLDLERADAGVVRARERENALWAQARGAQVDTATAAELRLAAMKELEDAVAEESIAARGGKP